MKFTCTSCHNTDSSKVAATKKGYICLCCYERTLIPTAENQKEVAELEIKAHLSRGSGGNNRRFTRAYLSMKNYLSFMQNMDDKSDNQLIFMKGFSKAIEIFESEEK